MSSGPTGVMSKAFWSQDGGASWAALQPLMDRLYQGISDAVIAAADPGAGGVVLDVGCGGGSMTLAMARRSTWRSSTRPTARAWARRLSRVYWPAAGWPRMLCACWSAPPMSPIRSSRASRPSTCAAGARRR